MWQERGTWETATVERKTIMDSRSILQLANAGLSVHSHNAANLIKYLAHILTYHVDNIPVDTSLSTTGWKTLAGERIFALGKQAVSKDGGMAFVFNEAADAGGLIDAFRPAHDTTALDWAAGVARLNKYPLAAFGVCAGFLAPFVSTLGLAQNPILDYAGLSSTGKSTLIRLIASIWGYPLEAGGGLIRTWNASQVFLERLAATLNDLPIFLDESHTANARQVQDVVYQYANGTGRGRGTKEGGTQRVARYRGVMFSAGEARLADASLNDGAHARILGFWGSPFGAGQGDLVNYLNNLSVTRYGVAGRGVLEAYFADPEIQKTLKYDFEAAEARLSGRGGDNIDARLCVLYAAIEAAGKMATTILELDWDVESIVESAMETGAENKKEASAETSMALTGSWMSGNQQAFCVTESDREIVDREVYGRIKGGLYCILPHALKRYLETQKYAYDATLRHWRDRGWIDTGGDKSRLTKKVKMFSTAQWMVVLTDAGMEAAFGVQLNLGEDKDKHEPRKNPLQQLGYAEVVQSHAKPEQSPIDTSDWELE